LTAIGGGQFTIKHLDDRVLLITLRPGEVIKPGKTIITSLLVTPLTRPRR
jgi:hypothetical protein